MTNLLKNDNLLNIIDIISYEINKFKEGADD